MLIKKHISQPSKTADNNPRLEAYARQGRSYCKARKKGSGLSNNFKKGSLAALIPLAAAGGLNAQCQGSVTLTIPSGNGATIGFDVDGVAGDDFRLVKEINMSSFGTTFKVKLDALGSFWFRRGASSLFNQNEVRAVTGTVTRGQASFVNDSRTLRGTALGTFSYTTKFAAIRKGDATTGQPGWIKMKLVRYISQWKIIERGVESTSNSPSNSAIIDDCASMAGPLPVEMTHFRAQAKGGGIHLEWATASEQDNAGFEVQRSTDGRSFAKIGWVQGNGTTQASETYSFIDNEVQANQNYYYRLQQMDNDGTAEFSPIRSAMVKDDNAFQVGELFPNPVSASYGFSMFKLNVPTSGEVTIQVFDSRGALVKELSKAFGKGNSTLSVPIADLPSGQYHVKLQLGQDVQYRKLVVN